jgi:hypothetical protein
VNGLTQKVEEISRFLLCVLVGFAAGFALLIASIFLAHEAWLTPYLCSFYGSLCFPVLGIAVALQPGKARV